MAGYHLGKLTVEWITLLSPDFWVKVFAISSLTFLIYWSYKSKKRIVITNFLNQTGDESMKSSVDAISAILLNELAALVRLYSIIDESNPYAPGTQDHSDREKSIDPNINVSGVGESLKSAVASDSKVKLGILEVPIGAIMSILGMTVEGPRLTGCLAKENDCLSLVANIGGGGIKGNWRISSSDLSEGETPTKDQITHMTRQLAYRIFTDLEKEHIGSPRWKAVCHYINGLSAYRETLRTDRDKNIKLLKAEREFLMALGEDKKFLKCYYNLGIIYYALNKPESAFSVLNKAIDPGQPENFLSSVYYALAQNHFWMQGRREENARDYEFSIRLCDSAIKIYPDEARAWDLKGWFKKNGRDFKLNKEEGKQSDYYGKNIAPIREIASALAWREMCWSTIKGKKDIGARKIAGICTRNLAVAHAQANRKSGISILLQSIHLDPFNADLFFELGKILIKFKNWEGAIDALEEAIRLDQQAKFWSHLAYAYSGLYEKEQNRFWLLKRIFSFWTYDRSKTSIESALYACNHAIDYISAIDNETLQILKDTLDKLRTSLALKKKEGDDKEASDLETKINLVTKGFDLRSLLDRTHAKDGKEESDEQYKERLTELKNRCSNWDLGSALISIRLSSVKDGSDKAKELEDAINKLRVDHPEIINQNLHDELANALSMPSSETLGQALYHAQRSVNLDPDNPVNRYYLAEVYGRYKSYDEANIQLKIGSGLDPEKTYFLDKIASLQPGFNPGKKKDADYKRTLDKYVKYSTHSLEILQSKSLDNMDMSKENMQKNMLQRSSIHYWLGYIYSELNEYDKAIHNCIIAKDLMPKSRLSYFMAKLNLGAAQFENKSYDECEVLFQELIKDLETFVEDKKIPHNNKTLEEIASDTKEEDNDFGLNDVSAGFILGLAYLNLASSYSERDTNFMYALNLVEKANEYIKFLKEEGPKSWLEAKYADQKGWLLFKLAKLGIVNFDTQEAIACLRNAICMRAHSLFYLHLALSLEYNIEILCKKPKKTDDDNAQIQRIIDQAFACCDHIVELDTDLQGRPTEKAKELRLRLNDLRESQQKTTEATDKKSDADNQPIYA